MSRRPKTARLVGVLAIAALGGAAGFIIGRLVGDAPESSSSGGPSLLLWLMIVVLCVLFPLNGVATRKLMRSQGAQVVIGPRGNFYLTSAILWAVLGGLSLGAGFDHETGLRLAQFAPPITPQAGAALLVAGAIVAGIAWWTRDLTRNRTKRAILRGLYRHGAYAIAPRREIELIWFRAMALVTSSAEEIAYRFLLLGAAVMWFGALPGLLLSSIVFGAAHLYQGWRGVAYTALFGVAAGILTLWADNLWPAIALHVGWNLVAAGALFEIYKGRSV